MQADAILIRHDKLCAIGWQLRLPKKVEPDFVSVGQYDCTTKKPPELWRLIMLELNSEIFDSCQKLVIGSINSGRRQTEETRHEWSTVLGDLRALIDQRATLLTGEPLTKGEHFAHVLLPGFLEDKLKAPPVVVWLVPWTPPEEKAPAEKARSQKSQLEARNVRSRWDSSSSWWSVHGQR